MFKVIFIYKIFMLVFISLLFVACGSDDTTVTQNQTSVSFYPIDVKKIAYEDSSEIYFGGDILINRFDESDFTAFNIQKINVDGKNRDIGSLNLPNQIASNLYQFQAYGLINNDLFVNVYVEYNNTANEESLKFDTYKIEDNDTISKRNTTPVNTEMNGYVQWDVNVNKGFFKNNLLALSVSSSYWSADNYYLDVEKVLLYTEDENNTFHYLQTLTSDSNETQRVSFGRFAIDMSENFLAVSEGCKVNIYLQDADTHLYDKTDSYTLDDSYCSLSFAMSKNHLFVFNKLAETKKDLLFTLDNDGKISGLENVTDSSVSSSFGENQIAIENSLFVPRDNGLNVYSVVSDANGSSHIVKSRDINLVYSPDLVLNGETTFLTGNKYDNLYLDFFEAYPEDRLYIVSDTNTTQYLDEGNIYPFYKIAASSIHEPVTYSLSGDDSEYFTIVDNAIVPKEALNYENPVDMDANNIYEITLNIRDAQGHEQDLDFHVHLRDRDYVTKAVSYSDDSPRRSLFFGNPLYLHNEDLLVGSTIGSNNLYLFRVDENNLTQITSTALTSELSGLTNVAKINDVVLASYKSYDLNDSLSSVGAIALYTYADVNTTLNFQNIFTSPNPTENGLFGSQILVDDNTTTISEPGTYLSNRYESTGKVYIYNSEANATFTLQQTLQAPDMEQSNAFGESISMDGDYLLVGAPGSSSWRGTAYLYKKDVNGSMQYIETLLPGGNDTLYFGKNVALSGSYFVISAYSVINKVYNLYVYQIDSTYNHVSLIAIINNVLTNRSDSMTLQNNNVYIATNAQLEGYDRVQDIIQHYQIAEDGSVNLKETLVNHLSSTSMAIRSFYKIVSDGDSIVVGNNMADVEDVPYNGSVTLYKKDQ